MAAAWFVAAIAAIQIIGDWYRSRDIDYQEGGLIDDRLVSWGTCRSLSGRPEHDFRYFFLHIPFVHRWERAWNLEWCWHHLTIHKFAGKWRYHWVPDE